MVLDIKSREQHLGDMVRRIKNNSRITNFAPGGDLVTILEAIASRMFKTELAVLKILEQTNIDNLTGMNLDLAAEAISLPNGIGGMGRRPAARASGSVTISSDFDKISTLPYAGRPAPYKGSTKLYLQDCSEFFDPTTAPSIYIARGTDRFEGPIKYTTLANNGAYWEMDLATALTQDHLSTDIIVLAQGGDRLISAGMQVEIPAKASSKQVAYIVDASAILADGENEITVNVSCTEYGSVGNASIGAITKFTTVPFLGATVRNNAIFSNGLDFESDASLRQRIKDYPDLLARGTMTAIKSGLLGAQDSVTNKTIVSTSAVAAVDPSDPTIIYIDDGAVLEPLFASQTYEILLASATGRERSFKTAQAPIAPVCLQGQEYGPYILEDGLQLTLSLDGQMVTYTIDASQYQDIASASVYEVIRDLNSQSNAWAWRVFDNGRRIVATDSSDSGEIAYAVPGRLQTLLGLPTKETRNIYLYKNGLIQSFKGVTATLSTRMFTDWDLAAYSSSGFLNCTVVIDGVTVTGINITNSDFAQFGATFSSSTIAQWRTIFEQKIPGVTATISEGRIVLLSNLESDDRSELQIIPGSGVNDWVSTNAVWEPSGILESTGRTRNFKFNRRTGDIRFLETLEEGDIIEIATEYTRGHLESVTASSGLFDVSATTRWGDTKMVVAFDAQTSFRVVFPVAASVLEVAVDPTPNYNVVRLTDGNLDGFLTEIEVGDWVYITIDRDANETTIGAAGSIFATYGVNDVDGLYRVMRRYIDPVVGTNPNEYVNWIEIEASSTQAAAWSDIEATATSSQIACTNGSLQAFASTKIPQEIIFSGLGVITAQGLTNAINDQITGGFAYLLTGQIISIRTNTYDNDYGSCAICAVVGAAGDIFTVSSNDAALSHTAESTTEFMFGASPAVQDIIRSGDLTAVPSPGGYVSASIASLAYTNRNYIYSTLNVTEVDSAYSSRPVIEAGSSIVSYPVGTQEYWLTGRYCGYNAQVFNTNTVAPFDGFLLRDVTGITNQSNNDIKELRHPCRFDAPSADRISHFSVRLEDLPLSGVSTLVIRADNDAVNKTVTVPLYKDAEIHTIAAVTAGGAGQVISFTLKDPSDLLIPSDPTSGRPFFHAQSSFKTFSMEGFAMLARSVGIYNRDPAVPSTDAMVLRSASFGANSRLKFFYQYNSVANTPANVSHTSIFDPAADLVDLYLSVSIPTAAAVASMATGTYSFTVGASTDNVRSCVLSSYAPAVAAQSASGAAGITYVANTPGAAGNSISVDVTDVGYNGLSVDASDATQKVTVNCGGTDGDIAELQAYVNYITGINGWNTASVTPSSWYSVCWSPDLALFCAVALAGTTRVMTSPDGVVWTPRTVTAPALYSVCWSPDLALFCAVGRNISNGYIETSPDGVTWTPRTPPSTNTWRSVCWSPELTLFCAIASSGAGDRAMTSPDGVTWTAQAIASQTWYSVCWSPSLLLFCAVANDGSISTSPDGVTWTPRTASAARAWQSVCWSPDLSLFCTVSMDGHIDTSPDGIVWTDRMSPAYMRWESVCWSPEKSMFCAVASTGTTRAMVSSDGITWRTQNISTASTWRSVCWSPALDMFCAVESASAAGVATSYDGLTVGNVYVIDTAGTTDFTLIGAADNNPGTEFVATGVGTGTGIVKPGLVQFAGTSGTLKGTRASVLLASVYSGVSGFYYRAVSLFDGEAGNNTQVVVYWDGASPLSLYDSGTTTYINKGDSTYDNLYYLNLQTSTLVYFEAVNPAHNPIQIRLSITSGVLTGGVNGAASSVTLSGGADETPGALGSFLDANHIVVINGSGSALPVGAWKLNSIVSPGTIEILVPDYDGLASVASVAASAYSLTNIEIGSLTLQDTADAINAYLDGTIAIAEAIGAGAATVDINEATYETHPIGGSLSDIVITPTTAMQWHAFQCNYSGKATISLYDPDTLGTIRAVVQSVDSIWPTTTQAAGTTYTPANEQVILVPTNTRTVSSWCGFVVNSALATYMNVSRVNGGTQLQLSAKEAGSERAIYAQDTYVNSTSIVPSGSASLGTSVISVPVKAAEAREFPRNALVRITNEIPSEIYRPYRHMPSGTSVTTVNTSTQNTWVRASNRWIYWRDPVTPTIVRLILCRSGQFSGSGTEPLNITDDITFTDLGNGLVRVTHSGTGVLSARTGDMMWIAPDGGDGLGSPFAADQVCDAMGTCDFGSNEHNAQRGSSATGMVYPGYTVLEVLSSTEIVILAPHITSFTTVAITHPKDLIFIPALWAEKNLKLNQDYAQKYRDLTGNAVTVVHKALGRGICALIVSNTATGSPLSVPDYSLDDLQLNTMSVNTNDWIYLCGGDEGFSVANSGWHRIIAHDGKSTIFLYNSDGTDEVLQNANVSGDGIYGALNWGVAGNSGNGMEAFDAANPSELRPIRVLDQDSVMVGHKCRISTAAAGSTWVDPNLAGTWPITDMGWINDFTGLVSSTDPISGESFLSPWVEFMVSEIPAAHSVIADSAVQAFGTNSTGIGFVEGTPFDGFKVASGWALDAISADRANLYLSPEANSHLITPTLGTELSVPFKLNLPIENRIGIDGYQIFSGLIQEAHKIIDGTPGNLSQYEGIKAAGTVISVLPPVPRPIQIILTITPKVGVALSILSDLVRSSLSTYISALRVGQPAIDSEIVSVVQGLAGIQSVIIESTIPAMIDGQIVVGENEKIVVISPSEDIAIG